MDHPSTCPRCGRSVAADAAAACVACGFPLAPAGAAPPSDAATTGPALDEPPSGPAALAPSSTPSAAAPESLWDAGPPTHRGGRGAAILVGGVAVVIAVGWLAIKVATGLLVAGIAAQALGLLFGGPYARLPADVRGGFERRIDAALGSQLDGLSDAESDARLTALVADGTTRLDDATLVDRLRIQVAGLAAADEATCEAFALSDLGVSRATDAQSTAFISALDDASLTRWVEINVLALEAAARGSPAPRTVTSEVDAAMISVVADLPAAETATLQAVADGEPVNGAAACAAERAIYTRLLALGPADLALVARYIISP
jgi:hypothetical protein